MRSWPVDRKVKAVFAVLTAMAFGLAAITVVHTLTIERNFSRSQDVRRLLSYFDTVQALTPRSIAAGDHGTDAHQVLWAAVDETLAQVASLESALSPSQRRALARFHNRLDYHRQAFMETVSDYRLDKHYAQEQLFAPVKLGLESGSSLQGVERTMAQLARFYVTRDLSVLEPIRAQLLQIKDRPLLDALSERVFAAESNYLSYLRILEREAFLSGALTEMLALGEELLAELELEARRIDRWLELGLFALLLLYVLIVLVVSMGALRYVRHFLAAQTYAVAQIEKGNYDYEPLPCADDELGRLGQLIKRVAIGLGQSQSLTAKSLNRLRLASESTGLGIWELDLQADRLEWDERMYAIYGRDPRHPVRTYADWSAVVVPEDLISVENDFQRAVSPTGEFLSHFRIRRPDGATRHIEGHGSVVHDARGNPIAIIGSNLDVTERTRSEERLRLAARVFGSAREAILTTDQRGQIVDLNPAFSELTGWSREQMIGRNPLRLRSDRHPLAFYRTIVRALKTHGYWRGEVWLARSDRVAFPGLVVISEVEDDAGQVTHYVGLIDDISSIKEQQRRLEHLARHDSLTQLPNRVLFADRLEQGMARARRSGSTLAGWLYRY